MKLLKPIYTILLIIILIISCTGDVDFEQANNLEFTPEYKIALVYFKLHNNDFIDPNTNLETPARLDFTNIEIFNSSTINKLEKVILKFEIENTFNRESSIDFILMDNNDNILLTIPFSVNQNENQSLEVIYLKGSQEFDNLIKATRIIVRGNILGNGVTTEDMFIHFKSAADLYLKVKDV